MDSDLEERLRRIDQKLSYLADQLHDTRIADARREKEEKLRKKLQHALEGILPMAKLWLTPTEPGHPGWRYLETAVQALDESRESL